MTLARFYHPFPVNMGGGNASGDGPMDLLSDTIKGVLTTNAHTISQAHETKSQITNEHAASGGYATGGHTYSSKTYDWSTITSFFKAADITYSGATISAWQEHLFDDTVTTPTDPLILYRDFEGEQTTTGNDFVIDNDATNGIFQIAVVSA